MSAAVDGSGGGAVRAGESVGGEGASEEDEGGASAMGSTPIAAGDEIDSPLSHGHTTKINR